MLSHITSIVHLRTDGAPDWDKARIKEIAKRLNDVPCSEVDGKSFESAVLQNPEYDSVALSRNPFGSATLKIKRRTPVAIIENAGNLALSTDGVVYPTKARLTGLPSLLIDDKNLQPQASFMSGFPWQRYADLAIQTKLLTGEHPAQIKLGQDGSIWLNMLGGKVKLGSFEQLDAKITFLKTQLSSDPAFLTRYESVNIVSPSSPVIVQLKS